jgi:nicotinate-nucleotide adenylyltransferase
VTARLRAAVLGGTFDPIHRGHLAIAEQVRAELAAAEVWLVPTGLPPHRGPASASPEDRLDMCRAAAAEHPGMRVLDLEARRPGPSYTVDTLAELEAGRPDAEVWLVLGADAAREFPTWHRREALERQARFVLVNRTGVEGLDAAEAAGLGFDPGRTRIVAVVSPQISATEVRRRVQLGEGLEELVPPAVAAIILERGLYRDEVG